MSYFIKTLLFATVLLTLIGCSPQNDILNSEEREWLKERNNEIVLAPDPLFFPYEWKKSDGSFDGMVSKYIKILEKKLNVKVKIKWYDTWSENVEGAKKREFDFWGAVAFTNEREKYMLYSKPYFNLTTVVIVNNNDTLYSNQLSDLYQTKVGVTKDWFTHNFLKENMDDSLIFPYSNDSLGFIALQKGEITRYVTTQSLFYYAHQHYLNSAKIAFEIKNIKKELHFASRSDEPILASIINKGLSSISNEERGEISNSLFTLNDTDVKSLKSVYIILFTSLLFIFFLVNFKRLSLRSKFIILLIIISFGVYQLIFRKNSNSLFTTEEIDWLEKYKDSLTIAPDTDFAPYEWIDEDGIFKGLAIDYIYKLEDIIGYKFKIEKITPWTKNLELAKKGEVPMWSAVSTTKERLKYMNFTKPYTPMPIALITRSDNSHLSLENWNSKNTIAVVKNYFPSSYLSENFPAIKLKEINSSREGLYDVATGNVSAVFVDLATASYIIKKERITSLRVEKVYHITDGLSFAIKKEWPILLSILDKALNSITEDEHNEIYKHWISYEEQKPYSLYIPVFLFTLLLLISAILWNRKLKKRVEHGTTTIQSQVDKISNLQNLFESVIEALNSSLFVLNEEMVIIYANSYAMGDLKSLKEINLPELFPITLEEMVDVFRSNDGVKEIRPSRNKDNKIYDISISPLIGDSVKGIIVLIDNVTIREDQQNQLQQIQKMETVGVLAGGIAHDLNNVLAGIIGTVDLILMDINNDEINIPELKNDLEVIENQGERASTIVKQLLTISHKQESKLKTIDLNDSIKNVLLIAQNSFDKSVNLIVNYSSEPAYTEADPTQIEQAILNLCVNGQHAMTLMRKPEENWGGDLTIDLDIINSKDVPHSTNRSCKEYWKLSITDQGIGIPEELQEKIFAPFFTTKDKGTGTGLGLSMIYNTLKQHSSFISLNSEVNKGTEIIIYFPASQKSISNNSDNKSANRNNKRITVLLVDDETVVRMIAERMLKKLNCSVLVATSGREAIKIFKKSSDSIDCVILDMIMPGLSGAETYSELKAINNSVPVILSTGFPNDERVINSIENGVSGVLPKPYYFEDLQKILEEFTN